MQPFKTQDQSEIQAKISPQTIMYYKVAKKKKTKIYVCKRDFIRIYFQCL